MHFQQDSNSTFNSISVIDEYSIKINGVTYESSVLITATGDVQQLPEREAGELNQSLWQAIIKQSPEVLLIGTGVQQVFLSPAILAPLYKEKIGVECMSSNAAARTFNVLMSEGRRVLALILLSTLKKEKEENDTY